MWVCSSSAGWRPVGKMVRSGPTGYSQCMTNEWLICWKQQQQKNLHSSFQCSFYCEAFSLILEEFSHLWMRCLHNWWRPRRLWLITWWNPLTTDVFKKGAPFLSQIVKCICSNWTNVFLQNWLMKPPDNRCIQEWVQHPFLPKLWYLFL